MFAKPTWSRYMFLRISSSCFSTFPHKALAEINFSYNLQPCYTNSSMLRKYLDPVIRHVYFGWFQWISFCMWNCHNTMTASMWHSCPEIVEMMLVKRFNCTNKSKNVYHNHDSKHGPVSSKDTFKMEVKGHQVKERKKLFTPLAVHFADY